MERAKIFRSYFQWGPGRGIFPQVPQHPPAPVNGRPLLSVVRLLLLPLSPLVKGQSSELT